MRQLSFACFAGVLVLAACASNETDGTDLVGGSSPGGNNQGGTAETGGNALGGDAPLGGQGGGGSGCAQDCSTIEVPVCYEAVCNEESGNCDIVQSEDDTPCEDGAFCTVDDTCLGGECAPGGPMDCTGGSDDPCLVPSCNEGLDTCNLASAPNGTACASTDVCLTNTLCLNGTCQGAPLDCSGTPLSAPECQAAACDASTGECVVSAVSDGLACTYGDICESDKVCDAGECLGTPIPDCMGCTETEPNATFATANSGLGCVSWAGGINPIGDHDCFSVEVTVAGSRIAAEVVGVTGVTNTCVASGDPYLRLFNSTGTQLATDDDGGFGLCSLFSPTTTGTTNLPVGTYSVCVEELNNDSTTPPYVLLLSALAPGCGDVIVNGTEECDGTNLAGQTCVTQGFGSGTLTCDASCAFDTSACAAPFCGDALVNAAEDCDGANLAGATCASEGFPGGTLTCNASCALDTSACFLGCGNGLLEFGESCDGSAGCTACTFACTAGQVPFSVGGAGLPIAITDNATFTSLANVSTTGTVASVGLQVNIDHTYDGDLHFNLTSPAGTNIDLSSENGGIAENYINTVFSANGTTNITAGTAPFTGVFVPEGSLASFNGQNPVGNWTFTVMDDASGDQGSINAWRVFGCINP